MSSEKELQRREFLKDLRTKEGLVRVYKGIHKIIEDTGYLGLRKDNETSEQEYSA